MPGAVFRRRPVRLISVVVLSLVIAGLVGLLLQRSSEDYAAHVRVVDAERQGVAYLRPLDRLIGGLAAAQSAAVRGAPVDAASVRVAAGAVDAVDRAAGADLGTRQRWADLRAQIDTTLSRPGSGRGAYDAFRGVVTLAVDLARRVGDTSNLILDPDLDSYYLMDAALLRLPDAMVNAGRAADVARLAGGASPTGEDAARVAVARHAVAAATADVTTGLRKSVDTTGRAELGPNVTSQLDAFRAAVDGFAPPVVLGTLVTPVTAEQLSTAAQQVIVAALALTDVVLAELDALLVDRKGQLNGDRRGLTGAAAGLAAATLLLLWALRSTVAGRPRPGTSQRSDGGEEIEVPPGEYADDLVTGDLVDARELDFEELVHVGRAVRPRRRERADDDLE